MLKSKNFLITMILIICFMLFIIVGIKYNIVLKYGLILITIFNGASFLAYIFKKRTDQTLAPSIFLIMIIMYLLGLIGQLKVGIYLILILYNVLGLSTFIKILITKKFDNFKQTFFPTGTIVFMLLYLLLAKTTFNRVFSVWDEFTYWSITPKNMFYLDDFVTNPNSTVITIGYPPFPATLQYFCLKIIGIYKQGIELFAILILSFSMLISIFSNLKKNNFVKVACSIFIMMAIPTIFCNQYFYYTIYGDALLGILIGYILYNFFTVEKGKFKIFSLLLASIIIAMTKDVGVVILCIIGLCLLCYYFIDIKNKSKNKKLKITKEIFKNSTFILIIIMILSGLLFYFSWKLYVKITVPEDRFEKTEMVTYEGNPIGYVLNVFVKSAIGNPSSQYELEDMQSVENLSYHLLDGKYHSKAPFVMSVATWIAISIISLIYIYRKLNDEREKQKFKNYSIWVIIGEILYFVFLQVAYILLFNEKDAIAHSSIERYAGSYLIGITLFITYIYIYYLNSEKIKSSNIKYALVAVIVFIFTPMAPLFNITLTAEIYNYEQQCNNNQFVEAQKYIESNVNKEDTVFLINQKNSENDYGGRIKYYITPIKSSTVKTVNGKNNTLKEEKELLIEEIKDYDFVFIVEDDSYFNSNYRDLFENNSIREWTLYKVNKNNDLNEIKLIPINK